MTKDVFIKEEVTPLLWSLYLDYDEAKNIDQWLEVRE